MKMTKTKKTLLWVSGALTLGICLVMNLWLIPRIERSTGGVRCFDMQSFGYTWETAKAFLSSLDAGGRAVYLYRQLPLDFVYPAAYTLFFSLAMCALRGRVTPWIALPLALCAADVTENVCTIVMLRAMDVSPALAGFASAVTLVKSLLMYLTFVLLAVFLVLWLRSRKKAKTKAE